MLEDAENQCHIRIVLAVIFSFESNNVLNVWVLSATTSVHDAGKNFSACEMCGKIALSSVRFVDSIDSLELLRKKVRKQTRERESAIEFEFKFCFEECDI